MSHIGKVLTGILVTVIGGVIVLLIQQKYFSSGQSVSDEPAQVQVGIGPQAPQVNDGKNAVEAQSPSSTDVVEVPKDKTQPDLAVDQTPKEGINKKDRSDFEARLSIVKKIYGSSERNVALEILVNDALAEGAYEIALDTAKLIYGSTDRNKSLLQIVLPACAHGKIEVASEAALFIYGSTDRNEALKGLIGCAIKIGDIAAAEKLADKVYGSTERNAQYRRILEAK